MSRADIFARTVEHFLQPIAEYLDDSTVSEIMVNKFDDIYVEIKGQLVHTDAKFPDHDSFMAAVNNVLQFTGKRLTEDNPLVDSRLPDGSRVHVVLDPVSRFGTCMCIRKFAKALFNADELEKLGTWTDIARKYLEICVLAQKNILVSGGTSSGKTCLMNVLSEFIPSNERIVTIEDSSELVLGQANVISLECRGPDRFGDGAIDMADLFKSSLRLRPDRIIIGEVRGPEALQMIQAMTSGHAGSMSTLHANTAVDALNRLQTLALMSEVEFPEHALTAQIAGAIDVVVQVSRFNDGSRRIVQISENPRVRERVKFEVDDIFSIDSTRAELNWARRKSDFANEPLVRALADKFGAAKELFTA